MPDTALLQLPAHKIVPGKLTKVSGGGGGGAWNTNKVHQFNMVRPTVCNY